MSIQLFTLLSAIVLPGEHLKFELQRQGDKWVALFRPVLKKTEKDLPEQARQVRANLATPLVLRGETSELDATFAEQVTAYAAARQETGRYFEELLVSLREAGKSAQNQSAEAKRRGAAKSAATSSTKPETAASASAPETAEPATPQHSAVPPPSAPRQGADGSAERTVDLFGGQT